MTVPVEIPRVGYEIPSGTVSVPVPFQLAGGDIEVWISRGDSHRLLSPGECEIQAGTLITTAGPGLLTLRRVTPLSQPDAWAPGSPIYAQTLGKGFDRATRQIQELAADVARALRLHPAVAGPLPTLGQPVPHGLLIVDAAGTSIRFDPVIAGQVIGARDQAMAAAAAAVAAKSEAYYSQVEAKASQVAARGAAETAYFFRNEAEQFALRAEAAQTVVLQTAERASWALGLMGLANNLTQLLHVVAPFLGKLFGIWRDLGWVNQTPQISVDFGWACITPTGNCLDFGLINEPVVGAFDFSVDGPARNWGLITDPTPCGGAAPAECQDDLGWINAVLPLNSAQPIHLPIRVPDPCPVIIVDPPAPPVPPPSYNSSGHC